MTGPTNVLLLSPYADALLPTFKRAGDGVTVVRESYDLEFSPPVERRPDWIVMYGWPKILLDDWYWRNFPNRIINLHISLLPWNRGADPNFWSWRDDTPKGVTIHQVDEGIDTGPILSNTQIIYPNMSKRLHTLATAYKLLSAAIEGLFATHWTAIRDGEITPMDSGPGWRKGTYHKKADLDPFRWALEDWNLPCAEVAGLEARP